MIFKSKRALARALDISEPTLWRWDKNGAIHITKIAGNNQRIHIPDAEARRYGLMNDPGPEFFPEVKK